MQELVERKNVEAEIYASMLMAMESMNHAADLLRALLADFKAESARVEARRARGECE